MKLIETIKELSISIVIVVCVFLILSVIFYNKISINRVIPESEEYIIPEKMEESIESEKIENMKEVVIQYYIDASDLKKYEKTNEYNKGKKNPFAKELVSNSDVNDININNESGTGNFYEDDGTK